MSAGRKSVEKRKREGMDFSDHDTPQANAPEDLGLLLVVDDDRILAERMAKALSLRGFSTRVACSVAEGVRTAEEVRPDYAVVDLRLGDGSGLDVVEKLRQSVPECRVVMLTAFGNIATAVAAVKAGAVDYLAKPADADAVVQALLRSGSGNLPQPPEDPMSAERVRWEHIQRIYEQCNRNISETARRLRMHRRTLQQILSKYAPKDST